MATKEKSRGDYMVADVVDLARGSEVADIARAAKMFPAFVALLLKDPARAFALAFGDKKAGTAETKIRVGLGLKPDADEQAVEQEVAAAVQVEEPEPAIEAPKPTPKNPVPKAATPAPAPAAPKAVAPAAAAPAKGKAKDEDELDALLNELEDADPNAAGEEEPGEEN